MGASGHQGRFQLLLRGTTSTYQRTVVDDAPGAAPGGNVSTGRRPVTETGRREGHGLSGKRGVLLDVFPGDKSGWNIQAYTKPEKVQQLHAQRAFPHGDAKIHTANTAARRLHVLLGSEGRIPSHSNPPEASEIPQVCFRGALGSDRSIPVDCSSLWPHSLSQGLYQDPGARDKVPSPEFTSGEPLSRRPSWRGQVTGTLHAEPRPDDGHSLGARIYPKPQEVLVGAFSRSLSSGRRHLHSLRESLRTPRESCGDISPCKSPPRTGELDSAKRHVVHRQVDGLPGHADVLHVSRASTVSAISETVQKPPRSTLEEDCDRRELDPVSPILDAGEERVPRQVVPSSAFSSCSDDRRIVDALRGVVQAAHTLGSLVNARADAPHKCPRDANSAPGPYSFPSFDLPRGDLGPIRQCHSSGISTALWGNEMPPARCPGPDHCTVVHGQGNDIECSPRLGGGQSSSGRAVPTRTNPVEGLHEISGVGVGPDGCQLPFQTLGDPTSGPVCDVTKQQTATVLHSPSGSSVVEQGSADDAVGQQPLLPLSSRFADHEISSEDQTGGGGSDNDTSLVAEQRLVPLGSRDAGGSPDPSPTSGGSPNGDGGRIPPFPAEPPLSCLETQREDLQAEGVSEAAAETIGGALRGSSRRLYLQKWKIFVSWCQGRDIHPLHCPPSLVVEYFEHLKREGKVKYNTALTHASALSTCLPPTELGPIGAHPLVCKWLKGFKAANPPRRLLVPPWDLNVVLAALREAPYEPLKKASLKALTFKTLFLVAITSARRVSELQALCAVHPFLILNPKSVKLLINPTFCPKTTTEVALRGLIELTQFPAKIRSDMDKEWHKNCPVRAVRCYLERTADIRVDNQLFVGHGPPRKGKAVSKQTLAKWLSVVIKDAYIHMGRDPPVKANAHTTRGIACSWAELARADLTAICEAATWTTGQMFAKHYRLDFAGSSFGTTVLEAGSHTST